jgi:Asp/Glu/hydantoin racemase
LFPGVDVFHMTDESLIRNTIEEECLTKTTIRRLVNMVESAHQAGADAVMVTCSSIGPGVEAAREVFDFPIFRIDEAMAETAVSMGPRIGVAATLRTTLDPTLALLRRTAERAGKPVELVPRIAEGAFAAVIAGDAERHDRMVSEMLSELKSEVNVVVLAQASMARVLPALPAGGAPILTSPELAVRQAREALRINEISVT